MVATWSELPHDPTCHFIWIRHINRTLSIYTHSRPSGVVWRGTANISQWPAAKVAPEFIWMKRHSGPISNSSSNVMWMHCAQMSTLCRNQKHKQRIKKNFKCTYWQTATLQHQTTTKHISGVIRWAHIIRAKDLQTDGVFFLRGNRPPSNWQTNGTKEQSECVGEDSERGERVTRKLDYPCVSSDFLAFSSRSCSIPTLAAPGPVAHTHTHNVRSPLPACFFFFFYDASKPPNRQTERRDIFPNYKTILINQTIIEPCLFCISLSESRH